LSTYPPTRWRVAAVLAASLAVVMASLWPSAAGAAPTLAPTSVGFIPDPFISGHAGLYGWGMATLSDGSVAVGDYWNLRVQHYAANGTLLDPNFVSDPGFGPNQHQSPYGMTVDPATGDLYMADTDRYLVHRYTYDPNTGAATIAKTWGAQGSGLGKYLYPSRVAIDSNGRVYVADTWANNIEVDTKDGVGLLEFGSFGTGQGQFKQPHGMAFDYNGPGVADDQLFVVNTNNKRIDVFIYDSATGYVDTWSRSFGCAKATKLAGCYFAGDLRGLAIDQANEWVYIVDARGNKIHKYTTGGAYLLSFGKPAKDPLNPGNGEFTDGGREVTVAGNGNVWVGDMPDYRAQVFSPSGSFLFEVPNPPAPPPDGGFNGPRGVAVDAAGNAFVTDTYNQRVEKFDAAGDFVTKWGNRGRNPYSFNYPRLLAVDPTDGSVVVADTDNHSIKKYANDGTYLWGVGGQGTSLGKFKNPHGIDVGPNGRIYVADSRNCRVVVMSPTGTALSAFGSCGTGNGQFKFPRGIAVDANGTVDATDDTLWVVDSVRDVVQHFTLAGAYLGQFGSSGRLANQLAGPFDIEAGNGYLFIADSQTHQIKIWTDPGPGTGTATFVMTYGSRGTASGQFIQPQGLDLSSDGQLLYVSEQGTDRIQIFDVYA
jgi:sugar lactone lactonase YvrE